MKDKKFYKDDIVEIIDAGFKSITEVPDYMIGGNPIRFIGRRYRIGFVGKDYGSGRTYYDYNFKLGSLPHEIMLHKRGFLGWLRYLRDKIIGNAALRNNK